MVFLLLGLKMVGGTSILALRKPDRHQKTVWLVTFLSQEQIGRLRIGYE
jgi:hypothetical protein